MRDNSDEQLARAAARRQMNEVLERRRAETFAEYNAEGEERRSRSSELRALRRLKEARDRAAAKTEEPKKKRAGAR